MKSAVALILAGCIPTHRFVRANAPFRSPSSFSGSTKSIQIGSAAAPSDSIQSESIDGVESLQVKAPLKYIGAYACLALRFPKLATANQKQQGKAGVSLDFVLATATNTNTIGAQITSALQLEEVGSALPSVGVQQGASGTTYMLGDTQLDGQIPIFMTDLTASAMPVSNPAAAGTLSLAFLQAFDGVDFGWGIVKDGQVTRQPAITFLGGKMPARIINGRTCVTLDRIAATQSPIVKMNVNGVTMTALLDTGSPISILSAEAAASAGIKPMENASAMNGEKFSIAGDRGQTVDLIKSAVPTSVQLPAKDSGTAVVDFGEADLFIGDIPGLGALKVVGIESPPTAVLGLNVLMKRPSMLLRAKDNELWFE